MKKKPKILAWCDTPTVSTGFGIVAKNLLKDIHKKYDLEILGINYHGIDKYDTDKWFIYPAQVGNDYLGISKFKHIIEKSKPDIIFLFQDIFHIKDAWKKIMEAKEPKTKIVIYFPVDGTPFSVFWKLPLEETDVIITYTNFAKQAILNTFPNLNKKIYTLYHGIDTNAYYPLTEKQIKSSLKELEWKKKFVIININRFQPRKLIPMTLRSLALFIKGYKICDCGNWYLKSKLICDLNGCDSSHVTRIVSGKNNVLLYLHMVPNEVGMGPGDANSLQAHAYNAGFRDEDLSGGYKCLQINAADIYRNPLSEKELNKVYNIASVNISSTIGEGAGLSLLEAAATGTISIAPNNSAIPEMLGNTGHLIKNIAHFNMALDNGHVRPLIDVRRVIKALDLEYHKWLNNNKLPLKDQACIDRVNKLFLWQDKRDFIENLFEKLLARS